MTENQITSLVATSDNEHLTQINEKNIYSFTREFKQDGQTKTTTVTINNQYAVARLCNVDAILNLNKNSNIALASELARIKKSIAEENGFKTVAQMVHAIHDDLSETTINAYRRVGIIFADLSSEVFRWKQDIPQNVSITNLVQVAGMVNVNKDTDKITQEEAAKAVAEFKEKYIDSDELHLLLPLSKLKEEIKRIQNTIDSTATEIDSKQADSKQADSKQADSKQADSKQADSKQADSKQADSKQADSKQADSKQAEKPITKEMETEELADYYISELAYIVSKFPTNKNIEKYCYKLQEELKKYIKLSDNEPS